MNSRSHLVTERMTMFGLLLAAAIVSLAMPPVPASAQNQKAPSAEGVYISSSVFKNKLDNRFFELRLDRSSPQMLQINTLSANKRGQTLSGKKDGGGTAAICAYLYNVITYPYADPMIKAYALSLYRSYGCQPAL